MYACAPELQGSSDSSDDGAAWVVPIYHPLWGGGLAGNPLRHAAWKVLGKCDEWLGRVAGREVIREGRAGGVPEAVRPRRGAVRETVRPRPHPLRPTGGAEAEAAYRGALAEFEGIAHWLLEVAGAEVVVRAVVALPPGPWRDLLPARILELLDSDLGPRALDSPPPPRFIGPVDHRPPETREHHRKLEEEAERYGEYRTLKRWLKAQGERTPAASHPLHPDYVWVPGPLGHPAGGYLLGRSSGGARSSSSSGDPFPDPFRATFAPLPRPDWPPEEELRTPRFCEQPTAEQPPPLLLRAAAVAGEHEAEPADSEAEDWESVDPEAGWRNWEGQPWNIPWNESWNPILGGPPTVPASAPLVYDISTPRPLGEVNPLSPRTWLGVDAPLSTSGVGALGDHRVGGPGGSPSASATLPPMVPPTEESPAPTDPSNDPAVCDETEQREDALADARSQRCSIMDRLIRDHNERYQRCIAAMVRHNERYLRLAPPLSPTRNTERGYASSR